jgi:hypothetical protein
MSAATQPETPLTIELAQEKIDRVANRIYALERNNLIRTYADAGWAILEEFFAASFEVWNSRDPSFPALARLSEALSSKGAEWTETRLYRAVRTHEQEVAFGGFERWPSLTVSHMHAVQGLPWDKQRELLDTAQAQRQQVRELQRAVSTARGIAPRSATYTAVVEASAVLRRLDRVLDLRQELASDLGLAGVSEQSVAHLCEMLEQLHVTVDSVSTELQQLAKDPANEERP